MRGILRPCRSSLGPEMFTRWQAHLCGLCLTLRDEAGQAERALTGYDVLLLSVLVEAQAGSVRTTQAGPCPLRGFRPATVVASDDPAAQLAAAGALLSGGAGLADKLDDDDLPRLTRGTARRVAARLSARGTDLASLVGLDPRATLGAPAAAAAAQDRPEDGLLRLLAPTGEAVASLFARTAAVAGHPENERALAEAGAAFGMLIHLLDAVSDHASDARAGRFNPLAATRTHCSTARRLADALVSQVRTALGRAELVDRALVDALFDTQLPRAVARAFPRTEDTCCPTPSAQVPGQRAGTLLSTGVALWALASHAIIIGGWSSGGGRRRRRRHPYYDDGYGYGGTYYRSGPSCMQCLACNCCANLACNACCCQ